ncbi:protein-disulfide isomerase [Actinomadura pelletieri DSM 43383]|uniref:Protein-disulfide isomerase n=1 Tax=Actinomadura pelletieri DSM 43383 TaxID=1120940 RepID=A0A495QNE7_9ACTN|nr:thioredoxin domain-containing protein [Actinomadura pelletieri]RKS74456.1 protein-disulfide isomerase [Actinomadura pelletieri DSM 43383]
MSEHENERRLLTEHQARAAARERRKRLLQVVLGGVAVTSVLVAGIVVAFSRSGGQGFAEDTYDGPLAPTTREQYGAVAMARPGVTTPVLDLYEDFQCPMCRTVETRVGGTIKRLAAEGRVKVVYRPFQLFQQDPLMSNSRRAANAAACLPVDRWVRYHDRLFAEQPAEGDVGFTTENLIKYAAELGVTDPAFAACVHDAQRIDLVEKASAQAGRSGVDSTPYLALNGRKVDDDVLRSPDELTKAVAQAGGGPAPAPGPRSRDTAAGDAAAETARTASWTR